MFDRDRVSKDNARIIIGVLKEEGPMTVRDITKVVSGRQVGDEKYSFYAHTVSSIIYKMLKKGNVDKLDGDGLTRYRFNHDLDPPSKCLPYDGIHMVQGYEAHVSDGRIQRVTLDGRDVGLYEPPEYTGRGIRRAVKMPISIDRMRHGLKSGRLIAEVR